MKKWKKVKTIKTHDYNGYYQVERDEVITPGGKPGKYSVVRGAPFSIIIPIDKSGNVWMVKQHRYPVDKFMLEVPAGMTDGEDPLIAAKRELEEETSLVSTEWEKIGEFHEAQNLSDIKGYVFVAYDVEKKDNPKTDPLDKDLFEVEKYPIEKVLEMIRRNDLINSFSISAVSMAFFQGKLKKYEERE